jgi:hypothetical protein
VTQRDPLQKQIGYTVAYGGRPAKLSRHTAVNLIHAMDLAARQEFHRLMADNLDSALVNLHLAVHLPLAQGLQTRIDEEGCGALFGAVRPLTYPSQST